MPPLISLITNFFFFFFFVEEIKETFELIVTIKKNLKHDFMRKMKKKKITR